MWHCMFSRGKSLTTRSSYAIVVKWHKTPAVYTSVCMIKMQMLACVCWILRQMPLIRIEFVFVAITVAVVLVRDRSLTI